MYFRKLWRGLRVVRNVLGVKVFYHVQSIYFLNKVCIRDHELSFQKKLILYNNSTQRYGRNKINTKLLPYPLNEIDLIWFFIESYLILHNCNPSQLAELHYYQLSKYQFYRSLLNERRYQITTSNDMRLRNTFILFSEIQ